jgi:alpha,alpha-trehalose phosphorylase
VIGHPAFPPEPWSIHETALEPSLLAQSESIFALANGHLGLRGNLDEGEPRGLSGTYLNGVYESFPLQYGERAYGWPEDGQEIVPVPDGKVIRLLVEDEPFDVHRGHLDSHERLLDLRTGILRREVHWRSESGRAIAVRSQRLVSFTDRNLAAISYEVEALEHPVRVAIQSNLVANQPERDTAPDPRSAHRLGSCLASELSVGRNLRVVMVHRTRRTGLAIGSGMEHVVHADGAIETAVQAEEDLGRVTLSTTLEPGQKLQLVKLLAYHWSAVESVEWLRDQVDASLHSALGEGFDGLAAQQRDYLARFWQRADIELDGDPEIQQALRFALFQVLQAAARTEGRAIPAKGLTGTGYDGHTFWDAETFVLPALTYLLPEAARSQLRWRQSTLPAARRRAEQLRLRGAAFPWRTIHGEECSAYWPAGAAAFHVNAAVAVAAARYVAVTGDLEFERATGVELLVETARLWSSLGHHGADRRFHIDGVTGPDEYSALVDDNVYTNLMARSNLRSAAAAAERHPDATAQLGVTAGEIAAWRAAADAMHVPYDEGLGVHLQDRDFFNHERWDFANTPASHYPLFLHHPYLELYRKQVIKQPDLVLALHLRGDAFTLDQKRRDFDYYEPLTVRDSSLAASTHAIVAAEVGYIDLAYDYLAEAALMDLADLEQNAHDGLHIGSLAGAINAAIAGLGGARDHDGELSFRPRLPRGLGRLSFALGIRDALVRLEVLPKSVTYRLVEGADLVVRHYDETLRLASGEPVTRAIPAARRGRPPVAPPGRQPASRRAARQSTASRPAG